MDFPETQKTGVLAEIDVARLFISWGWNAGQDRIDNGYDVCVVPERARYGGLRFLVQVKGTASRKRAGAIVAPVEKFRLRQYMHDALPVFIVRVMPDGMMYWEHAQAWAQRHAGRLSGSGKTGVKFDGARRLEDRQGFEDYLAGVLSPLALRPRDVAGDLRAQAAELTALDPRFKVTLRATADGTEHHVSSAGGDVTVGLSLTPERSPENIERLREAIEYGLPRSVNVENFQLSGSPLFERVGAPGGAAGQLRIGHAAPTRGVVSLHTGMQSISTLPGETLSLEADLYAGTKGLAINNDRAGRALRISIQQQLHAGRAATSMQIEFRGDLLASMPLQEFHELQPIASMAEKALDERAVRVEMRFGSARSVIPVLGELFDEVEEFFHWARLVSRMYGVARALNSPFVLSSGISLSSEEIDDIDRMYALLKGERLPVRVNEMEFLAPAETLPDRPHVFFVTSTLRFEIAGRWMGDVPVRVDLRDYQLVGIEGTNRARLTPGKSPALMGFDDSNFWPEGAPLQPLAP